MLTTRRDVRVLGADDLDDFLELSARDPVANVFSEHRARATRLTPRWLGGEVWGRFSGDELTAALHVGANLVPVCASAGDAEVFAAYAVEHGTPPVATLVGRREPVEAFWGVMAPHWPSPREQRWEQPHLETADEPLVTPDPRVRRTRPEELDTLYPACVAMYTEEVGISPETGSGGALYRTRVQQLVSRGWSFSRIDDGAVVFKAEVASVSPYAAQIQGVWVAPERRGEGLGTAGTAAVVAAVRREIAPVASLYVNAWNTPARRAYEAVGFTETGTFATVMF